jgi:hypothetical protein
MFHRHYDYFCEIDGRTSTDSHDQISFCVFSLTGNLGSLLARRVLCNSVKGRYMFVAERTPNPFDLIGLGVQGSTGEKEDTLCVQSLRLFVQSVRRGFAEDDTINCWKIVYASLAHFCPPASKSKLLYYQ